MSLLLGLLWRKNKNVYAQLNSFKDEMLRKDVESDKLALQCNYLEEKYQSLQQHIYESSPIVSKVRQLKERSVLSSKALSFSEKEWGELLRLQEGVYGLVSKLKEINPRLTEEDLRVCAFLREGIQPACQLIIRPHDFARPIFPLRRFYDIVERSNRHGPDLCLRFKIIR